MKILLFGRGVIATTYGWALQGAGHEVQFYVRPGRAAEYGPTIDLDLLDARTTPRGRAVTETWPITYVDDLRPDHDFDLIIVSVSHARLAEATAFLAPRVGGATVVVFGNVWSEPLEALGDLALDRVAWGFPGAGGGFDDHGVLRAALLPSVVFGTLAGAPSARELAVREVFRSAGFRIRERPDFRAWLFIHFIADAGVHSHAGPLRDLIGDRRGIRDALLTTRELLPLLQARGVDLRRHRASTRPYRAPAGLMAAVMTLAIRGVAIARRSLEMHEDREAAEPRAVRDDTLAEARRLGVAVPRLAARVG